jgi:hypothetical protein
MKCRAAAQAKSRTLSAVKCQVRVPPTDEGREARPISPLPRITTVVALRFAAASRCRWSGVSTLAGLVSTPVAPISMSVGTVRFTSKEPYSR